MHVIHVNIVMQLIWYLYLLTGAHRPNAVPMEPPVIKRVTGSSVLFYIDIAATTLPSVEFLRLGYTTIIIKVEDPSEIMPDYFVLVSKCSISIQRILYAVQRHITITTV